MTWIFLCQLSDTDLWVYCAMVFVQRSITMSGLCLKMNTSISASEALFSSTSCFIVKEFCSSCLLVCHFPYFVHRYYLYHAVLRRFHP